MKKIMLAVWNNDDLRQKGGRGGKLRRRQCLRTKQTRRTHHLSEYFTRQPLNHRHLSGSENVRAISVSTEETFYRIVNEACWLRVKLES